uniref:Uncharacterized protein n=1 Tax=Amphimedon queenslandica TaxID=400682 RepID=A0A1X7TGM6_AMPQE
MSSSRGASRKSPASSTRLKPNANFFNSPSQSDGVGKEGTVPESLLKPATRSGISVIPPKLWRLNIDPPDGNTASFYVDERWWDQVQYNELTCLPNNVIELDKLSKIFARTRRPHVTANLSLVPQDPLVTIQVRDHVTFDDSRDVVLDSLYSSTVNGVVGYGILLLFLWGTQCMLLFIKEEELL